MPKHFRVSMYVDSHKNMPFDLQMFHSSQRRFVETRIYRNLKLTIKR